LKILRAPIYRAHRAVIFAIAQLSCCVVRFDFSGQSPLPLHEHVEHTVEARSDGRCDAVLMWWELDLRDDGQLTLSTAPYWAHPTPDDIQVSIYNL